MTVLVKCPECGAKLKAPDTAVGKRVKCSKCQSSFEIPRRGEAASPAPPRDSREAGSPKRRLALLVGGVLVLVAALVATGIILFRPSRVQREEEPAKATTELQEQPPAEPSEPANASVQKRSSSGRRGNAPAEASSRKAPGPGSAQRIEPVAISAKIVKLADAVSALASLESVEKRALSRAQRRIQNLMKIPGISTKKAAVKKFLALNQSELRGKSGTDIKGKIKALQGVKVALVKAVEAGVMSRKAAMRTSVQAVRTIGTSAKAAAEKLLKQAAGVRLGRHDRKTKVYTWTHALPAARQARYALRWAESLCNKAVELNGMTPKEKARTLSFWGRKIIKKMEGAAGRIVAEAKTLAPRIAKGDEVEKKLGQLHGARLAVLMLYSDAGGDNVALAARLNKAVGETGYKAYGDKFMADIKELAASESSTVFVDVMNAKGLAAIKAYTRAAQVIPLDAGTRWKLVRHVKTTVGNALKKGESLTLNNRAMAAPWLNLPLEKSDTGRSCKIAAETSIKLLRLHAVSQKDFAKVISLTKGYLSQAHRRRAVSMMYVIGFHKELDNMVAFQKRKSRVVSVKKMSADAKRFPRYQRQIPIGSTKVKVRNPNRSAVFVGLRSGDRGRNFWVRGKGTGSVSVPDGQYFCYFIYANALDTLYKGERFTLANCGVEIQLGVGFGRNYGRRSAK